MFHDVAEWPSISIVLWMNEPEKDGRKVKSRVREAYACWKELGELGKNSVPFPNVPGLESNLTP